MDHRRRCPVLSRQMPCLSRDFASESAQPILSSLLWILSGLPDHRAGVRFTRPYSFPFLTKLQVSESKPVAEEWLSPVAAG